MYALEKCGLIENKRRIAVEALELAKERLALSELRFNLSQITRIDITFGTAMRRAETEKAAQIPSNNGPVDYDSYWQDNSLYCVPALAWTWGVRYALNLSGVVFAEDRRELRIAEYIPFFAVSKDSTPFVASFSPKNTASVGVDEASGVKIEIYFSESMDRKSAETAFSLDGASDKKFLWTRDDKTLSVTIGKPLSAWTVYHWSIKAPMP